MLCIIHVLYRTKLQYYLVAKQTYIFASTLFCLIHFFSLLMSGIPHNDIQMGAGLSPVTNFDKIEKSICF